MIADLKQFIERERPHWEQLDRELGRVREGLADLSDIRYSKELLNLFQRASSDLARIQGYSAEPDLKVYLENLVGAGYAEIHSATRDRRRFRPWHWLTHTFPQTFRRQIWGFHVALALTVVGMALGAVLVAFDVEGREAIYPFPQLVEVTPRERVAAEENPSHQSHWSGHHATMAGQLMQNNITVAFRALAFGMTWGLGSVFVLFFNGIMLGAVMLDYIRDGETVFMLGWLLPHGSFEIPAILVAGQGGLVLGRALIGWGTSESLRERMRLITPDLATLAGGAALMLVWAGFVESFFSQYHAPILPYAVKISFGAVELIVLMAYLFRCGKEKEESS